MNIYQGKFAAVEAIYWQNQFANIAPLFHFGNLLASLLWKSALLTQYKDCPLAFECSKYAVQSGNANLNNCSYLNSSTKKFVTKQKIRFFQDKSLSFKKQRRVYISRVSWCVTKIYSYRNNLKGKKISLQTVQILIKFFILTFYPCYVFLFTDYFTFPTYDQN